MKAKVPSRRLIIIGGIVAAGLISFFVLVPCTQREIRSRGVLVYEIAIWNRVDSAVRVYHLDHGSYPASLDTPDFQPYIGLSDADFLRGGRLIYHAPAADSPPTFIIVRMVTPRGDYCIQLDGKKLYPNSK